MKLLAQIVGGSAKRFSIEDAGVCVLGELATPDLIGVERRGE
jgi:hypothetical protein